MRTPEKLTIGMAVYEDYDGLYFTLQALRYYHQDADPQRIEYLIIDNCPGGAHSECTKNLVEKHVWNGRYINTDKIKGTAVRDLLFEEANTELVMCMDSHVLVEPGGIRALLNFYDNNPDSDDLIQGPLVYDNIYNMSTHMEPEWLNGLYGNWACDERGADKFGEPFDIPAQGLGLFSCRKRAWPGFNRRFSGFGGEEFYIHEKFRQQGKRTLCLPALRWVHRFERPNGTKYRLVWEDRVRNYLIGRKELGLPIQDVLDYFETVLGKEKVDGVLKAVEHEDSMLTSKE